MILLLHIFEETRPRCSRTDPPAPNPCEITSDQKPVGQLKVRAKDLKSELGIGNNIQASKLSFLTLQSVIQSTWNVKKSITFVQERKTLCYCTDSGIKRKEKVYNM